MFSLRNRVIKLELSKKSALLFILLMGLTSFFADMTYEGGRSIAGPDLAELGANAVIVGFVAGLGEFVGFALRFVSGYLVDRSKRYWSIAIFGYVINLFAIPLLALAGQWQTAAFLIVLERFGKAIRVPARDAMLSYAGGRLGVGWTYGIHEALDKAGGMLGPLIIALVLYLQGGYRFAFALLAIPALCSFITLFIAQRLYPEPQNLEIKPLNLEAEGLDKRFWIYIAATALVAAGYVDFPLIAYHFVTAAIIPKAYVPLIYAIAMGSASIAALTLGRLFQHYGIQLLMAATLISAFSAIFTFAIDGYFMAFLGMFLWSIGIAAQGALMRAVVAHMTPSAKRGSAFGLFNMAFGLAWFLGSFLMGILYDVHIHWLMIFSVGVQLLSLPLFWLLRKV